MMVTVNHIWRSRYNDSVTLMLASRELLELPGIVDAAIVMGTPANLELVSGAGLLTGDILGIKPDDLLIAIKAETEKQALAALGRAEEILTRPLIQSAFHRPKSLASAIAETPGANLAVISVAGRFAAQEAHTALEAGLAVLIFSDNVPIEDEIRLKRLAQSRGLLCMGPDAGTAIINGAALGFANAVPRGNIGMVGASGTGLQAIACGVAQRGSGISQAIGAGSRDLSDAVGGITTSAGLKVLEKDPETAVIVLVSKPPSSAIADRVLAQVRASSKPHVVCLLGAEPERIERAGARPATDLAQAAIVAAALAQGRNSDEALTRSAEAARDLLPLAAAERKKLTPGQASLRGLFVGGTFCFESQLLLGDLAEPVYSNAPLHPDHLVSILQVPPGHACLDLGADEFTQGRLHPMIDPSLRNRRIAEEARDPRTAVILLDVVCGYGAHPDPAAATAEGIRNGKAIARAGGRHISFVVSVCATEADPQPLTQQVAKLQAAGALVMPDSTTATRLAGLIVQGAGDRHAGMRPE